MADDEPSDECNRGGQGNDRTDADAEVPPLGSGLPFSPHEQTVTAGPEREGPAAAAGRRGRARTYSYRYLLTSCLACAATFAGVS